MIGIRCLHHFVGRNDPNNDEKNYQALLSILESHCIRVDHLDDSGNGYSGIKFSMHTDVEHSLVDESLMRPQITCYADIPLDDLQIHTGKYGLFGVSLRQDYLVEQGARPVMYIPMHENDWNGITGRKLLRDLDAIAKGFEELNSYDGSHRRSVGEISNTLDHATRSLWGSFGKDFLAFVKPYNADLPDNDPNYYIMENEWRTFGNQPFDDRDIVHVFITSKYVRPFVSKFPQLSDKIQILPR